MSVTRQSKWWGDAFNGLLMLFLVSVHGCATQTVTPVKQEALSPQPSDVLIGEKRLPHPGPPPFEEKLHPITKDLKTEARLFSMVFENAPISEILRALTADGHLNLVVDAGVELNRTVTLNLKNVTFLEALDMAIGKSAGYSWKIEDNNLYIHPFMEKIYHLDYLDLSGETEIEVGGDMLGSGVEESGVTGKYSLKTKRDSKSTDVWASIQAALDRFRSAEGIVDINRVSGIIYMLDRPRNIETMVRLLDSISESLHRQVFIEAKILEVKLNDSAKYGIDWSNLDIVFRSSSSLLPDNLNFGLNSGTVAKNGGAVLLELPGSGETDLSGRLTRYDQPGLSGFSTLIDFLKTQGDISVLSNPHLTVMNGKSALMTVGYQFPYGDVEGVDRNPDTGVVTIGTQIRRAVLGLQLGITPQISQSGIITLNIVPTITRIQGVENVELPTSGTTSQSVSNPIIDLQGMATTVRVREGETLVLAGLISQIKNINTKGLPFFSDLPHVGAFFKHVDQALSSQELVIFITPYIKNMP